MELKETTGSLDLQESINKTEEEIFYFVDFSKLTKVEDLLLVMASMGFGISNKHFNYDKIKEFLDHDRPVRVH